MSEQEIYLRIRGAVSVEQVDPATIGEQPETPDSGDTDTPDEGGSTGGESETPAAPEKPTVAGIRTEPTDITVQVGDHVHLMSYVVYSDGTEKPLHTNRYRPAGELEQQGNYASGHFIAVKPGHASIRNTYGGFKTFAEIAVAADDGTPPSDWGADENEPEGQPEEDHDPSDSGDPTQGIPDEPSTPTGDAAARVIPQQPNCDIPRRAFGAGDLAWAHTSAAEKIDVRYLVTPKGKTGETPVQLTLDNAPVGVTPLRNPDGSNHYDLAIARYSDCIVVEDIWLGGRTEYEGLLEVDVDGETIISEHHVAYLNRRTAAIRKNIVQIEPTRDWDPSLTPHYETPDHMDSFAGFQTESRSSLNGLGSIYASNLGSTGGKQYIGVQPGHALLWALKGGMENWQQCRFADDHAGAFPSFNRDPINGRVADPSVHTAASMHPNLMGQYFGKAGGKNPITRGGTSPNAADNAHYVQFGVISYLSTKSDYDLETIGFLAAYELMWGNPDYRDYELCLANGQVRGQAWQLRSIMYYARLLPDDHPDKASWLKIVSNNAKAYWNDRTGYAPGGAQHNYLGIIWGVIYPDHNGKFRGVAGWQQHHFTSAVAQGVRMGFEEMRPLAEFVAGFAVGTMTKMCYLLGSIYSLNVIRQDAYIGRKKDDNPAHLIESWKKIEIDNFTVGHNGDKSDQLALPCAERDIGEGKGVMFNSNGNALSFPANLQPALAAGVDLGLENAQEAWDLFRAHSVREERQDELDHIDYSQCATYSIVPDPALVA